MLGNDLGIMLHVCVAFIALLLVLCLIYMCAGLSGLRELSLDNTVITDQGIKYIAGTHKIVITE